MDFGVVGLDSLVCSNSATNNGGGGGAFSLENASDPANNNNNKQRWPGFGFLKQDRSAINEDDFRDFKVAKTCSSSSSPLLQRSNNSNFSDGPQQQMLSFSSPSSQTTVSFPSYYQHLSSAFGRSAGYGSTGMNAAASMVVSGVRGPFTPSQWMELEHQALIYKYITANVPIPSYLLNPIRKAFESAGFNGFSALRSNALGWGAFHLGFSNTDPEPGRCRRTDGKKWRCSRDAVADQKYCERHMNRGRHRSRKPVEGQSGHAASSATTTTTAAAAAAKPAASASIVPAGGASNCVYSSNHLAGLIPNMNRSLVEKENGDGVYRNTTVLSMTSPEINLKDNKRDNAYEESSSLSEFGLVCSDSLLNPLNRSSSLVHCRNYTENKSQHSLRQFMDDWPKNQTEQPSAAISWPETQLSISIPIATSDFMSSTSSPANEKLITASPPSQELEMGLGVGPLAVEQNQRQANWVPISWEPSLGGPLGEALHTTNSGIGESKTNTKPLNLMDRWDNNSPRMASSPTGVLQRGAFVSLSNSSAGSSPRAESSRIIDGASLCNGLAGPILTNPSLPAL